MVLRRIYSSDKKYLLLLLNPKFNHRHNKILTLESHDVYTCIRLSEASSRPALGTIQLLNHWVLGAFSRARGGAVNRPGREADYSPPSSAEVKNAWSYTSTLSRFSMAWCLIKQRHNLLSSSFWLERGETDFLGNVTWHRLLYQPQMIKPMTDEFGALARENRNTQSTCPSATFSTEIGLFWDWTRASAVRMWATDRLSWVELSYFVTDN
jgi:hypothetical protein